jgi:hypothetical protein
MIFLKVVEINGKGGFITLVTVVEKGRTKEQFDKKRIIRSINKAAIDNGLYLKI